MHARIDHVSITVTNLQNSLAFYNDLGFYETKSFNDGYCIIKYLQGAGSAIELFKFNNSMESKDNKETLLRLERLGLTHFAIEVKKLKKLFDFFNRKHKCSPIQKARLGGFHYFFLADPDGNMVELLQYNME